MLIFLFKGYAHTPYEWSPSVVDIQMFRVGNVVILVIPGEMTTMAGRRIRYVRRPILHPTVEFVDGFSLIYLETGVWLIRCFICTETQFGLG